MRSNGGTMTTPRRWRMPSRAISSSSSKALSTRAVARWSRLRAARLPCRSSLAARSLPARRWRRRSHRLDLSRPRLRRSTQRPQGTPGAGRNARSYAGGGAGTARDAQPRGDRVVRGGDHSSDGCRQAQGDRGRDRRGRGITLSDRARVGGYRAAGRYPLGAVARMEVVAVDVGGTHARFAIAEVANGKVVSLGEAVTLNTADFASLQTAWRNFGDRIGRPLPNAAALAVASS